MSEFLFDVPAGAAPADILDRAARIPGMRDVEPSDTIGAAADRPLPVRILRGGHADGWADVADAFGDVGFRLHPDTPDFPAVASFCAPTAAGTFAVATYCEGDLSLTEHAGYADACAWLDVDAASPGSTFAFQR